MVSEVSRRKNQDTKVPLWVDSEFLSEFCSSNRLTIMLGDVSWFKKMTPSWQIYLSF